MLQEHFCVLYVFTVQSVDFDDLFTLPLERCNVSKWPVVKDPRAISNLFV